MISPSPTQRPPDAPGVAQKQVKSTPVRPHSGQSPTARFLKAIFRPIFRGIYYLLQAIRTHKLASLAVVILLLASIFATSYFTTGELPLGIGNDQFNFHIRGGNGGGDHVKNWLYALRDGNVTQLGLLDSELIQTTPPDINTLVSQYSQAKAHLTWKSINVAGVYSEADTSVESFVEVDISSSGPGGNNSGILIFHFTTLPSAAGRLLFIDLITARPPLQ